MGSVTIPGQAELDRLKLSPEIAYYLLSRGYELPNCPPKLKTPEPRDAPGAYFDPLKVDHVVRVFSKLQHTTGKWRGRPIILRSWQIAYLIGPTYGWVRPDSDGVPRRIVQRQFLDIPRKNAKTTVGGGQCIYLTTADGEPGAQVYALATNKEQAKFCFNPVRDIAERAPELRAHVRVLRERIEHPHTSSYFSVMASIGAAMHGASPHGAFVDEVHLHRSRELIEAVETGTGARTQPLIMYATTADDSTPNTPYSQLREYLEKLAAGVLRDVSFYGVVFAADPEDDPFSPKTWLKANPGLAAGDSPTMEFLEKQARSAKNSPAELASFLRLHLGIRTKQVTKYLEMGPWDDTAGLVDESKLGGRKCHGGLDLASVSDITALCWDFPGDDDRHELLWRFWLPEDALPKMDQRTAGAATVWVRNGFLTLTPGNVIDNDFIVDRVLKDADTFDVQTVGFDRWGATDIVRRLGDEGLTCVPVGQGFASLSAPLKEMLRLVLSGRYVHGGNPVMRWMVDNLAVRMDPSGNVKPDKERAADKIDGVAAAVVALKECMDATAVEEQDEFFIPYRLR